MQATGGVRCSMKALSVVEQPKPAVTVTMYKPLSSPDKSGVESFVFQLNVYGCVPLLTTKAISPVESPHDCVGVSVISTTGVVRISVAFHELHPFASGMVM